MTKYTGPVPPMPLQYKRDWQRVATLTVGAFALVVGALLIIGIGVTSA